MVNELLVHSRPIVGNDDTSFGAVAKDRQRDMSAGPGSVNGVLHDVIDRRMEPLTVRAHDQGCTLIAAAEADSCECPASLDLAGNLREIDARGMLRRRCLPLRAELL